MKTIEKYEKSRNHEPTKFYPEWLKDCTIEKYLVSKGTARNKLLNFDLFSHVTKMSEVGETIQAIGYNSLTNRNTVLILRKSI